MQWMLDLCGCGIGIDGRSVKALGAATSAPGTRSTHPAAAAAAECQERRPFRTVQGAASRAETRRARRQQVVVVAGTGGAAHARAWPAGGRPEANAAAGRRGRGDGGDRGAVQS